MRTKSCCLLSDKGTTPKPEPRQIAKRCHAAEEEGEEEGLVGRLLSGDDAGGQDLKQRASETPYRDRRVQLKVSIGDNDTRILVRHDGPGRLTRMRPAPGTPESFELEFSIGAR